MTKKTLNHKPKSSVYRKIRKMELKSNGECVVSARLAIIPTEKLEQTPQTLIPETRKIGCHCLECIFLLRLEKLNLVVIKTKVVCEICPQCA